MTTGILFNRSHSLVLYIIKIFFVGFPWVVTSTGPGGFLVLYFLTGTLEGSSESGFMKKLGIKVARCKLF